MSKEDVGYYIHNITINWRKSIVGILDVSDLVLDAEKTLSPTDWYEMKNSSDFPFGDSWISKMKLISRSKRFRTKSVRDSLPANYNLIYQYARLSQDEWDMAKDNEAVISPDATLKMLMEWLIEYRHNKHSTNCPARRRPPGGPPPGPRTSGSEIGDRRGGINSKGGYKFKVLH